MWPSSCPQGSVCRRPGWCYSGICSASAVSWPWPCPWPSGCARCCADCPRSSPGNGSKDGAFAAEQAEHALSEYAGTELGGRGGIHDHLLEHRQVVEVAPAAQRRDATQRLWTVALVAFAHVHELRLLEYLQVAAQVAIRESAQLFQITERKSLRVCDQRG